MGSVPKLSSPFSGGISWGADTGRPCQLRHGKPLCLQQRALKRLAVTVSSLRLADANETWTGRRCGQTYGGDRDERGIETGGKGEDKEMMTTVGRRRGSALSHISLDGGVAMEE
eukprot:superscaffoldBa00011260_g25126